MRTLLLCALLISAPVAIHAADDNGGAFGDLVRKPVNTICPLDGRPIDASLQPVGVVGPDNKEVLVGTDSVACQNTLRAKFGQEGIDVARAASANLTLAAQKAKTPASTQPPVNALATAPQTPPPTFGQPVSPGSATAPATTSGNSVFNPTSRSTTPIDLGTTSTLGTTPAGETTAGATAKKKSRHSAASKEMSEGSGSSSKKSKALYNERGDESDERQRQKKAAQRRDMGSDALADAETEPAPTTSHHHHKKKKSAAAPAPAVESSPESSASAPSMN